MEYILSEKLNQEPFVKLASGKDLENWDRNSQVIYNQQNRQRIKHVFFINAFDYLHDNNMGHRVVVWVKEGAN